MMKEKMMNRKMLIAGLTAAVICLAAGLFYFTGNREGHAEPSAEETMETVKETVTVPGIKAVETTAQMQAVSQTEQTVEPSGGGSVAMVPEGTEETDREPLKETAKANQIQDGTKPQLPEQASEPMREPEPQEVEPAHEGEAPPSAEPQPPAGGTSNGQGQVYVPGFGYVDGNGSVTSESAHSDGDWDKQIGTMQ